MNINRVLEEFGRMLDSRMERHGHRLTTEDSIRYDFFYALTQAVDIKPWEIILESPYPLDVLNLEANGSEIDLLINSSDSIETGLICEFKYDRKANSSINSTNRYGKLINDILRLCLLKDNAPSYNCLFIYVSDGEMMNYKSGFYKNQVLDTEFHITPDIISLLKKSSKDQLSPIFLNPFVLRNIRATCNLIYKRIEVRDNISYGIYSWLINSTTNLTIA